MTESYDSPEEFARRSRQLTAMGWMIARVNEQRVGCSNLARMFGPRELHFEVLYERLLRRSCEG